MVLSEAKSWLKSISEEIKAFIDNYKEKVPNTRLDNNVLYRPNSILIL